MTLALSMSFGDLDWTAVAAIATAVAAGVTAWMASVTRQMATHAEAQVATARDALESAHRPVVVTTARTARLPYAETRLATPTVTERGGIFVVPVRNVGPGAALNVHGVLMWQLEGEEDGEHYKVTTTVCASPHPVQLGPGDDAELEFEPLNPEPISAPDLLLRLWYASPSGERYWTAEHLASHVQGYRSMTGRWPMPSDVEEVGALPDEFAEHLTKLRREALAERYGSKQPRSGTDSSAKPD